jgi:hypothetical protein
VMREHVRASRMALMAGLDEAAKDKRSARSA